ncbi:MAG TPA: hypothetical protein VFD96_12215 [Burkholderiaceae bacterium]|nr:hypothetical protein [bacterium SGD-2]HZH57918.1 hypothetical protein [Burkholderiaceae bacterium]
MAFRLEDVKDGFVIYLQGLECPNRHTWNMGNEASISRALLNACASRLSGSAEKQNATRLKVAYVLEFAGAG